jgi:REP element-mobilizing transposase RayT
MGRRLRPHSPGTIFHLVTRIHRRESLLTPELRTEVAGLLPASIGRTDAQLLAYAIMPNHLHVLLRQGETRLGAVMQPLLRRVAHRVQAFHGLDGTVFERRYRDSACLTPDHVREAIMYVHLNPWRAGLCSDELDYLWTTQRAYLPGADPASFGINARAQERVLELFALTQAQGRDDVCLDMAVWLKWRMGQDRAARTDAPPAGAGSPRPDSVHGDRAWRVHFAPVRYEDHKPPTLLPDLRDFVMVQLGRLAPGCSLEDLLGTPLPHPMARLRRRILHAAARNGYRTGSIARFFAVSPGTVSAAKYSDDL